MDGRDFYWPKEDKMKNTAIALVILISACAADPQTNPQTDTFYQSVCRDDPDTCPGGHPLTLKQWTDQEGRGVASSHGWSIISTPEISCNASGSFCHGTFYMTSTQYISTMCESENGGPPTCNSLVCTKQSDGSVVCSPA